MDVKSDGWRTVEGIGAVFTITIRCSYADYEALRAAEIPFSLAMDRSHSLHIVIAGPQIYEVVKYPVDCGNRFVPAAALNLLERVIEHGKITFNIKWDVRFGKSDLFVLTPDREYVLYFDVEVARSMHRRLSDELHRRMATQNMMRQRAVPASFDINTS